MSDATLRLAAALRLRLAAPLPGIGAQYLMAPYGRERIDYRSLAPGSYRDSAVLAVICDRGGRASIPLIERSEYEGIHSGQIALPGGKHDPGDGTFAGTAVRECEEEIGIGPECELLGALTPLYIPVSRYVVHPFVALYPGHDAPVRPHAREVKSITMLDLERLTDPSFEIEADVNAGGLKLRVPCFDLHPHRVWGATAMMLAELREIVRGL